MSQKNISGCGPVDGGNKGHQKELDRKDSKKDQDSRSIPGPNNPRRTQPPNSVLQAHTLLSTWTVTMRRKWETAILSRPPYPVTSSSLSSNILESIKLLMRILTLSRLNTELLNRSTFFQSLVTLSLSLCPSHALNDTVNLPKVVFKSHTCPQRHFIWDTTSCGLWNLLFSNKPALLHSLSHHCGFLLLSPLGEQSNSNDGLGWWIGVQSEQS